MSSHWYRQDKHVLHVNCQVSLMMNVRDKIRDKKTERFALLKSMLSTTLSMDHLPQYYLECFINTHTSAPYGIRPSEAEAQVVTIN